MKQRLSINFAAPADLLKFYLQQLSYDVDEFGDPLDRKRDTTKKAGFIIFKCIRIVLDEQKNIAVLEWKANPTSDAYAESVLSTILRVDTEAKVCQVKTSSYFIICKYNCKIASANNDS